MGFRRFLRFLVSVLFMAVVMIVLLPVYRLIFGVPLNMDSIGGIAVFAFSLMGIIVAVKTLMAKYYKAKDSQTNIKE